MRACDSPNQSFARTPPCEGGVQPSAQTQSGSPQPRAYKQLTIVMSPLFAESRRGELRSGQTRQRSAQSSSRQPPREPPRLDEVAARTWPRAARRSTVVHCRLGLVKLKPHRIEDREGSGETSSEDPGKIPHRMSPSVCAGRVGGDIGRRHATAQYTIDPRCVGEHDWQKDHRRDEHDEQSELAR
jgi:hypothetical protein